MKSKRVIWAALLTGVAVMAMVGYTSAGAALPMEQIATAVAPPLAVENDVPAVEAQAPTIAPEVPPPPGLVVTIRSEELESGTRLTIFDADGNIVKKAGLDAQIGAACALAPGADYTVTAMDGLTATFYLEENASISNVQGAGWTDGEVLYLTASPRCTLTVLVDVQPLAEAETVSYLLTGAEVAQRIAASREDGETQRKLIFSDLAPGDYTLTAPDGSQREITLTPEMPAVSISLA